MLRGYRGPTNPKEKFRFKKAGGRMCWINVSVRTENNTEYKRYWLRFIENGTVHPPEHYSNATDAIKRFDEITSLFSEPEPITPGAMSNASRYACEKASEIASRFKMDLVELAVTFQNAMKRLGGVATLGEAVEFYMDHYERRKCIKPRLFSEIADEILAEYEELAIANEKKMKEDGTTGRRLTEHGARVVSVLTRAKPKLGGYIENHTTEDIRSFLLSLEEARALSTIQGYISALKTAYILARNQKHLPRDEKLAISYISANDLYKTIHKKEPDVGPGAITKGKKPEGFYCASEAHRVLRHFHSLVSNAKTEKQRLEASGWLFILVLRMFFGIRMSEIWKLLLWDTRLINFVTNSLRITSEVSKTGEGRFLPIWPVIVEWLEQGDYDQAIKIAKHYARSSGFTNQFRKKLKRVPKLVFIENGFRDSAGSHLFVLTSKRYTLRVMGHDFEVFLEYYQHEVSDEEAARYYQIFVDPEDPRHKIHPLKLVSKKVLDLIKS